MKINFRTIICAILLFLGNSVLLFPSNEYKPKIVEPITETWRWQNFPELNGKGCQCMVETKDGLIYFGVNGGIIRYDGIHWKFFQIAPDYSDIPVVSLACASDGNLFVGTSKGVKIFRNEKWEAINVNLDFGDANDFPYNKFPIIEASDKSIWIGSRQGALRIKNGNMTLYRIESSFLILQNKKPQNNYDKIRSLVPFDVYSIFEDKTGKIWIGLRDGSIFKCSVPPIEMNSNLSWHNIDSEKGYVKARFPLIKMDNAGNVCIICGEKDGGINIGNNNTWKQFSVKKIFGVDDLHNDIILLKDGTICVGGIGRVFLMKNNQWKMYERTHLPFPSNRLRVFQTANNNLWIIGLSNDVWRIDLSFNKWITYKDINFQAEDNNGNRWFITYEGTVVKYIVKTGKWIQYGTSDGLIDSPVAIFVSKNGDIWAVGSHSHIAAAAYFSGEKWITQNFPRLSWGIDRRAVIEDKDGSIWFGTCSDFEENKGQFGGLIKCKLLSRYPSVKFDFQYYPSNENFRLYGIYGIGQSPDGNIWTGQLGFYKLDHSTKKWEKIVKPIGLSQNFVDCIQTGANGDIWVGTRTNGLFHLNSKTYKWDQFTTKNGLATSSILDILCNNNGNIWIASDKDISQFDGSTWTNNVFPGVFKYLRDGISIKSTKDGSLWVNQNPSLWYRRALYTDNYLNKNTDDFRTVRYHPDKLPPQTEITFSMRKVAQPGNVILSWSANDPWKLTPTDQIQYSYRFDDRKWSAYSNKESEIFLSIASGNHTFEVKARNRDLNADPSPAKVTFYVEPPTWKEPWFVCLILAFIAIITSFIIHLYHRNEIIQELSETRARLFTNISHELRTPLTLIMGPLGQIKKLSESNKELSQPLKLMERNCQRLLRLINQILDYRKIEVGQMKFEPSKGNIIDFVQEELRSFSNDAESKKIKLKFISPVEKLNVWFDPDKIEKIIFNLLGNALKFTPAGGTVSVEIKHHNDSIEHTIQVNPNKLITVKSIIEIIVSDTGIGISEENLGKIFDSFFQVQDHLKNTAGGTGIGLAVVKEMVKIHHGEISVQSKPGEGTTFSLKIPVLDYDLIDQIVNSEMIEKSEYIKPQHVEINDEELSFKDHGKNKKESKILIVEDNSDMRQYIGSNLIDKYEIMEAVDGVDGFEKALSFGPDLIISDIMMPLMDGIELCKKIKTDEQTSHIAVILLTARSSQKDLLTGLETGADDYLAKPFNSEELQLRIHNIIETRKRFREKFSISQQVEPKNIAITSVDQKLMQKALDIIEEHMDDAEFSVETFSSLIGMNRVSLYHKIKSLTNLTTREFFTVIRLKRAAQLLKESGLSVTEIAYQVGFKDPSHFSKLFKKQFGKSPKEYIKESAE